MTITITPYQPQDRSRWNQHISDAKNTHFMFDRNYMEYHQDRFDDASLLFTRGNKLMAVMPANIEQSVLISHGGLSFGGLVMSKKITCQDVMDSFTALIEYAGDHNIHSIRYKTVPSIYHTQPAQEDQYALFRANALLVRRDISSTIQLDNSLGFSGGKRNGVSKARKNDLTVEVSEQYDIFFALLAELLKEKYGTVPTHTAAELLRLAQQFPDNIKLYVVKKNGDIVAGSVVYVTETVVHTQYLVSTVEGRSYGALDYLIHFLINEVYSAKRYFDFGISTESQGRYLNNGLINQKELFGARGVVFDTYEINVSRGSDVKSAS